MSEELGAYLRRLEDRAARLQKELDRTATLRDQFAMAALPAIIQCKDIHTTTQAAETAYKMADAMMEKRK